MRSQLIVGTAAVLSALLLASCSGGDGDDKAAAPEGKSPVEEFNTAIWGNFDPSKIQDTRKAAEEEVAKCMAKQGFDYKPSSGDEGANSAGTGSKDSVNDGTWLSTDKKTVEKEGYGILMGLDPKKGGDAEAKDPNGETTSRMSPSELEAWNKALFGSSVVGASGDDEGSGSEEDTGGNMAAPQGCMGKAWDKALPNQKAAEKVYANHGDFFDKMGTALPNKVAKDPELKPVMKEWSSCMTKAGYGKYETPKGAADDLRRKYGKIDKAYLPSEERDSGAQQMLSVDESKLSELAKIKPEEIKVALADFNCRKETKYNDRYRTVQYKVEQKFMDENASEVKEIKNSIQTSKKK